MASTDTKTFDVNNIAPGVADSDVSTPEDTPVLITLNATDENGDALEYVIDEYPLDGELELVSGNEFRYTPYENYNGPDYFTYYVTDGSADSDYATVSIDVTPVNDAPVADDLSVSTDEDASIAINLSASDVEGDPLAKYESSSPAHGTLTQLDDMVLLYTPASNYYGLDSFTYSVDDGLDTSNNATVSITVNQVNDVPNTNNETTVDLTPTTIDNISANQVTVGNNQTSDQNTTVDIPIPNSNLTIPLNLTIVANTIRQIIATEDGVIISPQTANISNVTTLDGGMSFQLAESGAFADQTQEVVLVLNGTEEVRLDLFLQNNAPRDVFVLNDQKLVISPQNATVTNASYDNSNKELKISADGNGTQEVVIYVGDMGEPQKIDVDGTSIGKGNWAYDPVKKTITFQMYFGSVHSFIMSWLSLPPPAQAPPSPPQFDTAYGFTISAPEKVSLKPGETKEIELTLKNKGSVNIPKITLSADPAIVSFDNNGFELPIGPAVKVKATVTAPQAAGDVSLTITAKSGYVTSSAKILVSVKGDEPKGLEPAKPKPPEPEERIEKKEEVKKPEVKAASTVRKPSGPTGFASLVQTVAEKPFTALAVVALLVAAAALYLRPRLLPKGKVAGSE